MQIEKAEIKWEVVYDFYLFLVQPVPVRIVEAWINEWNMNQLIYNFTITGQDFMQGSISILLLR